MPFDGDEAIRCLELCFTSADWDLLSRDSEFQDAVARVKTLDDLQNAATLGADVLRRLKPVKTLWTGARLHPACHL